MVADKPKTKNILNILLPKTLPMAMSVSPFRAATTEVINSGNEVPAATIVNATTEGDMPKSVAMPLAPSTSQLPPKTRSNNPMRKNRVDFNIDGSLIVEDSSFEETMVEVVERRPLNIEYIRKPIMQPNKQIPSILEISFVVDMSHQLSFKDMNIKRAEATMVKGTSIIMLD